MKLERYLLPNLEFGNGGSGDSDGVVDEDDDYANPSTEADLGADHADHADHTGAADHAGVGGRILFMIRCTFSCDEACACCL